jgi:lysozyme
MKISDDGLRLIKSFEGYHTRQPDGSCVAYLCPANVPTIGWGCTEGVTLGMRWTEADATAGLRREMAKHEAAVMRLVTVEINQNQFDALTSFSYNCGISALQKSTLLKRLNKGDYSGAAEAFGVWNKGGGKVLPGLVARRAREAALFMKPVVAPAEPAMPQKVEKAVEPPSRTTVGVGVGTGALALPQIPDPPDVSSFSGWQTAMETVSGFGKFLVLNPVMAVGALAVLIAVFVIPRIRGEA